MKKETQEESGMASSNADTDLEPKGKAFGVSKANADTKGLDTSNLIVKHIQVNQAPKQRRRTYRAHGRVSQSMAILISEVSTNNFQDQPLHVQPLPH
jgi:hypothetical protein